MPRPDPRPLRLAFLKPVLYNGKAYWPTVNHGWVKATKLEYKLHNHIEDLVKELLTLKKVMLELDLTDEQKATVHAALSEASASWVHTEEVLTAVKAERQACADVAALFQRAAFDPHLALHIAGEILNRPLEPVRRLNQCEVCGHWPFLNEVQPRLDRLTGQWKCGRCMPVPAPVSKGHRTRVYPKRRKDNVVGRKNEGLNE